MTHLTACKSAGRQDRDSVALILKRNSAKVSLGQTDQLLVVHTCGRYKLNQQICENQANLPENQGMKMCPNLQQQPAPCEELCSGCWCSPQDSGESESCKQGHNRFLGKLEEYIRLFQGSEKYSKCVRTRFISPGIFGWSQHALT